MPLITADRVYETSTTTGTGAYTLAGAKGTTFQAFSAVAADTDTVYYAAFDTTNGGWEVGLGTWGTGDILTRTTILKSSNANAAVSWAAGTREVFLTIPADQLAVIELLQNSQSAAYTLVLSDSGKHILHPSADTTARTWTIPANASVAYPIGTAVTFINQNAAGVITIAITTDVMRLAGFGTTGSRTLAANGVATAIKITATEWIINGSGSLT